MCKPYRFLIATIALVTPLFFSSCASYFVRSFDSSFGGETSTERKMKAAAFDSATLPIQAVVIPVAFAGKEIEELQGKDSNKKPTHR